MNYTTAKYGLFGDEMHILGVSLFVALVFGHFLHEAPLASNAGWNDSKMLSLLQMYPNCLVADAASTALCRHLWCFYEHLIGQALFDSQVDPNVKRAMGTNLQLAKTPLAVWRVNTTTPH